MRVIILAAGQSLLLDGFHKLLIHDPLTKKTILDTYLEVFKGHEITVVVGYKALEIMNQYPELNYVYNKDWATTNNSGSLALALTETTPCLVLSSDSFITQEFVSDLLKKEGNHVVTGIRESRGSGAINCMLSEGRISEVYHGAIRNVSDPESLGIFKIQDSSLINNWRRNCMSYPHLFAAENLNFIDYQIRNYPVDKHSFFEVNTVYDYMRLINARLNKD